MGRSFERSVDKVLQIEGGYSNIPSDPGGKTRFGITEEVARDHDYEGDMEKLPLHLARDIYQKDYWDKNNLDELAQLSEDIAYEVFDAAVNMGNVTSVKFLQRALNIFNKGQDLYSDLKVDGILGEKTVSAFKSFHAKRRQQKGCEVLKKAILAQKGSYYIRLAEKDEKFETFVFGWISQRT